MLGPSTALLTLRGWGGGLPPDPQERLMGLAQAEEEMGQRASPPGVQLPSGLKRQWSGKTKLSIPCGNVF